MRSYFLLAVAGMVMLSTSTGCSKDSPATGTGMGSGPINPPPVISNRPPVALAGEDFIGTLYSNVIKLRGHAYDQDMGNTISTKWTQIAGAPCTIVSPQSLVTPITNLLTGEYLFELLATDNHGATDRDTVIIKVNSIEAISSPVNIYNLTWGCPMGCTIPVYNIYPHLPQNTTWRIYIKFVNSAVWHEAVHISQYGTSSSIYFYEIENGENILLYTDYESNIKIDARIIF